MATIIIVAILVGIMIVTRPMRRELDGTITKKDKKVVLYDLEGYLQLGVGFTVVLMLLAAVGVFGYDFYTYVRIATSVVMLILIYQLLRYELKPSLLLVGLISTLVLFRPIERFYMSRNDWILVDLVIAVVLPVLTYFYIKNQRRREKQLR